MSKKKINKLTKKLLSIKDDIETLQAKESDIKSKLEMLLVGQNLTKTTTLVDDHKVSYERVIRTTVPKAAITDIKSKLPEDVFNKVFNTSYSLSAAYKHLTGKHKKIIDKHTVSKPSPLKVTVKEVME